MIFKFFIFLSLPFMLYADGKYDLMLNEIEKPRQNLTLEQRDKISDPFLYQEHNKPMQNQTQTNLVIQAIFDDSVKINQIWYKIGESIDRYKIVEISGSGVILASQKERLNLSISKELGSVGIK